MAAALPYSGTLWAVESQVKSFGEMVPPRGFVEWMVNLTSGRHHILRHDGTPRSTHEVAWLSGLQCRSLYIEIPGPPYFVAASLHAAYAGALIGLAPLAFTETVLVLNARPV